MGEWGWSGVGHAGVQRVMVGWGGVGHGGCVRWGGGAM